MGNVLVKRIFKVQIKSEIYKKKAGNAIKSLVFYPILTNR